MAERVRITGKSENEGIDAQVSQQGNLHVQAGSIDGANKVYETASFIESGSPATHNFFGDTGRTATSGYIICDGPGDIKIDVSRDGLTYDDKATLKSGEILHIDHMLVNRVRITWVSNSAYRINLI